MKELTERQKEVLSFIAEHISRHSYPPTVREIAEYFTMSVEGAHEHITALRRKNCLQQDGKRSRTMKLTLPQEEENTGALAETPFVDIPLVGTVAAGIPILSEENREGTLTMHRSMLKRNKEYFALKIRGDSMSGVGIMDGDTAIIEKQNVVENGEIAVAVVDDAVTLKRFYREKSRIKLQAENPDFKPIYCQDVRVLGRLSHIMRNY
jgi:repressor LexA